MHNLTSMTLELPYPPSINHYWLRSKRGGAYISKQGRLFRDEVIVRCLEARVPCLQGRLEITVDLHPPDRRVRDIDNAIKSLADALQHGGAFADDSQIDRWVVERRDVVKGGKAVVRLKVRAA